MPCRKGCKDTEFYLNPQGTNVFFMRELYRCTIEGWNVEGSNVKCWNVGMLES